MLEIIRSYFPINVDREEFMRNISIIANEIDSRDVGCYSDFLSTLSELHKIAKKERRTIVVAGRKVKILLVGIRPAKFRGERIISWTFHFILYALTSLLLVSAHQRRKEDIIRAHKNEIKRELITRAKIKLANLEDYYYGTLPHPETIKTLIDGLSISEIEKQQLVISGKKGKLFIDSSSFWFQQK
jgi:hypothetical protein